MMHNKFDVVIVGAGSAGLMCARELGRKGYQVLLLDRKDDIFSFGFNTLGSFLVPKDFGLSNAVIAQEIDCLKFCTRGIHRTFKENKGRAAILNKRKVHEELFQALDKRFVTLKTGVYIQQFEQDEVGNITSLSDQQGNKYSAKIVIDATGTIGYLSRKLGLQPKVLKYATGVEYNVKYLGNPTSAYLLTGNEYEGGYGWVFPLGNQRAIVGFGSMEPHIIKELKPRFEKILQNKLLRKLVVKDNDKCEGGSIPITEVHTNFVKHNLICVGDSVSQVNPVAGEGYKFILESAIFAVNAIDKALQHNDFSLLEGYVVDWKNRFLKNFEYSKYIQEKWRKYSKNDLLLDFVMLLTYFKKSAYFIKKLEGEYHRK